MENNYIDGVSIVICTYNGKKTICHTLKNLANQIGIEKLATEIIVVDNASTDGTAQLCKDTWESFSSEIEFRIFHEPQKGKAYASSLAFDIAKYKYILVCDDDNFLDENYVLNAYLFLENHPNCGAVGGKGIPVFESVIPTWFNEYETVFAVGEQDLNNFHKTSGLLWGAGMVFRKIIWERLKSIKYSFFLNARRDKTLIQGGDDSELCILIKMLGYNLNSLNVLTFEHFMPEKRMTNEYLLSRFAGFGRSRLYLHAYFYIIDHNKIPGEQLRFPLWFDRWVHLKKIYIKLKFARLLCKESSFRDELSYVSLKSEIRELWKLKSRYLSIFDYILDVKHRIHAD